VEHVVEVHEESRVIIVRLYGEVTVGRLVPVAMQERMLAREMDYGVVFDFRESQLRISRADAFYFLARHYNPVDPSIKYIRTAHLVAEKDRDFFMFLEVSWVNRGALLRVFEDEREAIGWLEGLSVGRSLRSSLQESLVCGSRE